MGWPVAPDHGECVQEDMNVVGLGRRRALAAHGPAFGEPIRLHGAGTGGFDGRLALGRQRFAPQQKRDVRQRDAPLLHRPADSDRDAR